MPISLILRSSKALKSKVPFTNQDDLSITIVYKIKTPLSSSVSMETVSILPGQFTLDVPDFRDINLLKGKTEALETDWFPAPQSGVWSIEVQVIESSAPKKWLDKVAKAVREVADD